VTSGEDNSPLPGVNVIIKGTTTGTSTAFDGTYRLSVPDNATLVFSFVGFVTQEVAVGNRTALDVKLAPDSRALSEVVIIGYGEQSNRNRLQAVSTVKAEAFANVPAISPQQLLQGQAAGVNMVNSSGVLGANSTIRIRGAASISGGSSPLFVIDGVPLNDGGNGGFSTAQGAGTGLNPLLDLNPNDIESMTVLKDAAAVAIYGSRGANGVILIKTRRGSEGKTRINFDYATGFSEPTDVLKYMSGNQFKSFVNDWRAAGPAAGQNRGAQINFPEGDGFDWVDAVLRTGSINTYNLSMSGGSEKTTFFVGAGFHDEKGFTIGNDLKRLSGRLNLDHKISKKVRAGVSYSLSNTFSDRIGAENSTFAPLTSSYLQDPTVQPRDAAGNFLNTGFIANVLAIEALNDNKFFFRRQVGNIYGEVDILPDLTFRTEAGIDWTQSEEKSRVVNIVTPGGTGSRFVNQDYKWLVTNTLKYQKEINNHTVGVLLGQAYETAENEFIQVAGTGFVSDQLRNVSSASVKSTTEANGTAWGIESYFSRVNYAFKNRYLVEASVRRDGSSRFGADTRYGNFWAVSGGWILSDEAFLSNVGFLDFLKLTASTGTSGNDRIGNFNSLPLFGAGVAADYAGSPGLIPTQVPNPFLGWEETRQTDFGLSTVLFNNRVSLDVNYFVKKTTGILLNVPLPFTTGFPSRSENVGEMDNRGWDIQLNTTNIQKGGFTWTTSFNIGFLKNEVLSLPENQDEDGRNFIAGSTAQRAVVGHSQNSFYLIRYAGINPDTGDAEWFNRNGERTSTPVAADRKIVGSAIPDFTGGITNTFRYKGFELMAFFNFAYGNFVLIDGLRFTENMGGTFNKSTDLLNYWRQPGDNAFAPALTSRTAGAGVFNQLSTLQLQNGSYMRLKNLMFSYNLPKNLLEKTRTLTSARVFVMGQNLWTLQDRNFRGPDPEVSANGGNTQILGESFFALPQARMVTFGVNLGL
jgi:TonB-linked SusC/RagA family outer membrane protein